MQCVTEICFFTPSTSGWKSTLQSWRWNSQNTDQYRSWNIPFCSWQAEGFDVPPFINMTCVWECSKMWCNASKELDPTCSISVVSVRSFVGFVGSAWHSSLGSNHFNFRCNKWMVALVTLSKTKNDQIAGKKYVFRSMGAGQFPSLYWAACCGLLVAGLRFVASDKGLIFSEFPQWTEFC